MVKAAALRTPVAAPGEMTCNRVMPNPVNALIASKTDAAGRLPNFGFWSGRRLAYAEPVVIGRAGATPCRSEGAQMCCQPAGDENHTPQENRRRPKRNGSRRGGAFCVP